MQGYRISTVADSSGYITGMLGVFFFLVLFACSSPVGVQMLHETGFENQPRVKRGGQDAVAIVSI